jgi:hypothetical protein
LRRRFVALLKYITIILAEIFYPKGYNFSRFGRDLPGPADFFVIYRDSMETGTGKKAVRVCFVSPKAYPLFDDTAKGVFGGADVDLYMLDTKLAKGSGREFESLVFL